MSASPLLRSTAVLLLVACGKNAAEPEPASPPDAPGPHHVGVIDDELQSSAGLTLPLQIWYPTGATGGRTIDYVLAPGLGVGQVDAKPKCNEPRPVVMFSHGNGGLRYQSLFLTEHLASHGWVVAAPGHVGNTTFDLDSIDRHVVGARRPLDMSEAFDNLVARSTDPGDALFGCIEPTEGYAIVGHSFGGWTTLVLAGATVDLAGLEADCPTHDDFLCGVEDVWTAGPGDGLADDRVWAAVPMTPVGNVSLAGGIADIVVPTLVIGGLLDVVTPWDEEIDPIYRQLTTPERALAGIDRTGHFAFSDLCVEGLMENCGPDALPLEEAHVLINGLVLSWLRQVRGEEGVVLPPEHNDVTWEAP